jgi:hypothetical protein
VFVFGSCIEESGEEWHSTILPPVEWRQRHLVRDPVRARDPTSPTSLYTE